MSKKNKLLPELRFPEFANEGEWEKDRLDNLFDLQDGYPFSSFDFTKDRNDSKQVIRITDINNQNRNKEKVYVTEAKIQDLDIQECKVSKGDLLLSLTGAAGFNFFIWNAGEAYINQRTMKLSAKKKENEALTILLEPLIYAKINALGTGQNNNLSKDALKGIEFRFPKPPEQKKIASCLSSLDEEIAAHSKRLELLGDHKKALIQNLFPQQGEFVPKYRFPDFKKEDNWKKEKLGDVAIILKGKGISKSDIVENGRLPCIMYGELYTHYHETIRLVKSFTNLNANDLILSEANDVIIPASGETKEDIATASCVLEGGIALGGDLNIIRTQINGIFLSYFLNNVKKNEIAQLAQGDSVVHLYPNQLKTLEIILPKQTEQQKIASCLSALDNLIVSQINKVEQLKIHKKGLMQKLFPKMS